jgi:2-methylisocitrate lyase-like PEP mutase family enzyme
VPFESDATHGDLHADLDRPARRRRFWRTVAGVKNQPERAAAFEAMHAGEPFVIPNPWDTGSARVLEALGFRALATTSSGFAFTLGRLDGGATLDDVAAHVSRLTAATDLPVSVDLENGYGAEPERAALAVRTVADAGAVGGSIEDWDPSGRLYDRGLATERVRAAAEAVRGLGFPFMLTGRAENHIRGNPDLDDTIARLQAYEHAGASVLYAPGLRSIEDIRAVCESVAAPVNVLALPGMTLAEIVDAGAQRVSVGGGLAWAGVEAAIDAATRIRDDGDFSGLRGSPPSLRDWFA